jgi:hypothetical protein
VAYLENGHDPKLDRPTVIIRRATRERRPVDRRALAVARELDRLRKKERQVRFMRKELDRVLRTDPTPEAFKAYKRLDGMEKWIRERVAALKAAEADLDRQRLLRKLPPPAVVVTPIVVVPIRRVSERAEQREWVSGWRQRLKDLEKKGVL